MDEVLLQQCLVGMIYLCIFYEIVAIIRQNILAQPELDIATAVRDGNATKAMKKMQNDCGKQVTNFRRFPSRNLYQMRSFRD